MDNKIKELTDGYSVKLNAMNNEIEILRKKQREEVESITL